VRAAVIRGADEYGLETRAVPEIGPDELLLEPLAVGICRTDVELLDGTMVYLRSGRGHLPLTPGHEWVARVAAIGEDVQDFSVGRRVVGECSIGCGRCDVCLRGAYHQCPRRHETGVLNLDGAMSGAFAFPARAAHVVPDTVADEDAVFAEPTSVALRAVLRAAVQPGDRVLVVGGGTIGWLATALILDLHDVPVRFAEPRAVRAERLERLGAAPAAAGEEFDVVIEASGSAGGATAGLRALADSGRFVAVGLTGLESIPLDLDTVVVRDQTIMGSLGSPGVWPQAIGLLGRGRVRPSTTVTARYPLAEFATAVAEVEHGGDQVGKVLVLPQDEDRG
jgi:threonine dehydrogenase-like Zn-dependent dehydrogenase